MKKDFSVPRQTGLSPTANHTVFSGNGHRKPTILVVDDEPGPREALKIILHSSFDVCLAETAAAALRVLHAQPVDLVVLDQKLPDRSGIDLLQDIKRTHAHVEVIIITGYGSLSSALTAIHHGAAGYLLKPFNTNELLALVNHMLEKKRRLDFIRTFLRSSPELWGSEEETARAWETLKHDYRAMAIHAHEDISPHPDLPDCLPLLSDIIEATDRRLWSHSCRVSFYAGLIGTRLDLTDRDQRSLTIGAFLHDLGKTFPTLRGSLQEQNLSACIMKTEKQHPLIGASVIRPLELPAEVSQIILYHHERWDGLGYPHGLKGEGIPYFARIVSVSEAFDYMTVEAPDRSNLTIEEAARGISRESGSFFDPSLVDLFVEVLTRHRASLPPLAVTPVTVPGKLPTIPASLITQ
ncbi:MAG: response regulator [Nitrospira sp.]|nr:response regulator [Nitrospira sp.]MCP9462998.1 response regulator [Nitrospira sp.]MCP9475850.1 response regulator [Nitrospira sp.]